MHTLQRWTTLGLLAGLLALPASLTAQQQPDRRSEAEMERLRRAFPAEAADRIAELVSEAEADGLPRRTVLAKALEGAAKGIPADRVVPTVAAHADRLRRARELLPPGAPEDGLTPGADALQRGADPEAVREVAGRAGEATPEALIVLGDLAAAGVPMDRAVEVVNEALDRGRRGEGLLAMPAAVQRLTRRGTPPGRAARAVARVLAGEGPPSGVPPVRLPPQTGGPPVPAGAGPPGESGDGPPENGPPDDAPGGGSGG